MTEAVATESPKQRRIVRWFKRIGILLLVLSAGIWALLNWLDHRGSVSLAEAIAEADRIDPNWRIADVEANRSRIADDQNAALAIQALAKRLPAGSIDAFTILGDTQPASRLSAEQRQKLTEALAPLDAFRKEVRLLGEFSAGRFPITYSPGFLGTKSVGDEVTRARDLAFADFLERLDADDTAGAIRAWSALFAIGQAVGDEPMILSQFMRSLTRRTSIDCLERLLAQAEPDAAALAAIQSTLETDEPAPLALFAIRGERAGSFEMMEMLKGGAGQKPIWTSVIHAVRSVASGNVTAGDALAMLPGSLPGQQAAILRFMNRVVVVFNQPVDDWGGQLSILQTESAQLPALARMLAPAVVKVGDGFRRSHAEMRCAIVAVAAERYRVTHGTWPDSLDALVSAKLLSAVPRDPIDGRPLRMKRTADGLVVYSVGANAVDDDGAVTRPNSGPASLDLGIRLWDVAKRRQPSP